MVEDESYRDEAVARGHLTNQEYRAKLREEGIRIPSRHYVLMSKSGRAKFAGRVWKKRFSRASSRIENKVAEHIKEILENTPSFKQKQIEFDKARGTYESRTFLENTLREKGIEPAAEIIEMKAQYEEWKSLSSDTNPVPEPSDELRSREAGKWARSRHAQAEEAVA
tara:strand:- start:3449 stop:3949 length:501 start_codon:yes stop_codon:yes gene_type:complete